MVKVLVSESNLEDIADAIRGKDGSANTYTPSEMATAIQNIPSGGSDPSEFFEIEPASIANLSSWVANNYLKKADKLEIPSSATSLVTFFQLWYAPVVPKVICGNQVTNMANMYGNANENGCTNVVSIDVSGLDTSRVTNMSNMFNGCAKLVSLDLSDFDFSNIAGYNNSGTIYNMFNNCTALTNLQFGTGLGTAYTASTHRSYSTLDLSSCNNLTHDSLMSVINNLYDLAGNGKNHQYLTLGATNMAKLTSAEIQIATDKGWDVQ